MLPQIENDVSEEARLVSMPSKTYKLDFSSGNLEYIADAKNMVRFRIEKDSGSTNKGHLYALPQSYNPEIEFSISNGHLIATSNRQEVLNRYSLVGYNMYYEANIYGDRIMGYVDGVDALKQSIYHILMTERYTYLIYNDDYGVEFEKYIGASYDYINATIQKTLEEALLQDDRIKSVIVNSIEKDKDNVAIDFTVNSAEGVLNMEVGINV